MTAVLPLLPLYLQQIGVTERDDVRYWTGALSAAPFVVAVFATPIWGTLADRFGHKPMVVRSVFGIAISSIGMGFSNSPLSLLGWRGFQGAVSGVFPAAVGMLSSHGEGGRVGHNLAFLQAARSAGALSGPLLGGLLADLVGIRPLFLGVGTIALCTAVVCLLVLKEPTPEDAPDREVEPVPWSSLVGQGAVLWMIGVLLVYQVVAMASWPTLALFVEKLDVEEHAVATMTGLVVFAQGLPAMLVATSWARMVPRFGLKPLLCAAILFTGVTNLAVGLASSLEGVLALRALSGLAMGGFIPLSFQWLNDRAAPQARGRMASFGSTTMMLGNVIGSIFGSWLSVQLSLSATFWVPGTLLTVVGVAFLLSPNSRQ